MERLNQEPKKSIFYLGSIQIYLIVKELAPNEHLYPVYLASYFDTDRKETIDCVVKAISDRNSFENELQVYSLKRHSNILRCIESIENYKIDFGRFSNKTFDLLVLPYLKNGDLVDLLKKTFLDEQTLRYYIELIIDAVEYLHKNGLAHRDIKIDNILLDDKFNPILIDFGHTVRHSDEKGPIVFKSQSDQTTPGICPPEFHKGVGYVAIQMDMFALGRLIFNLATGFAPFKEATKGDDFYKVIQKGLWELYWKSVDECARSSLKNFSGLSSEFKELVQGLLNPNPEDRLTIEKIRKSAWFENTKPKPFDEIQCQMMRLNLSN